MGKEKIQRACAKLLVLFLAAMAGLTFLSKVLDSLTIPEVTVGYIKKDTVSYEVKGTGILSAGELSFVDVPEGVRIARLERSAGEKVAIGDPLFTLHQEDLAKQKEGLELELEKARISLQQEQISAAPLPEMTEEELGIQRVDTARRAYQMGEEDLKEAQDAYAEKTAKLEQEYNQNLDKTEDQLLEETRRQYKNAEREYDAVLLRKETALKAARREIADCEKKLKKLEAAGGAQEEIEDAVEELERAQEDYQSAEEEQDLLVADAKANARAAESDYEDIRYDNKDTAETLKAGLDAAIESEQQKLRAAEKAMRGLEEGITQAEQELSNARISDANALVGRLRGMEISQLKQKSMELDIQEKQREINAVDALISLQGQVCADVEGTLVKMELEPGKETAGMEQVQIGLGSLILDGKIEKDLGELVKPGTKLSIQSGDNKNVWEATVESVDFLSDEDEACIKALVQDGAGHIGAVVHYSMYAESGIYPQVIPISALREDNLGYYCLVTEPRRTILGEELVASRVSLAVLEKSSELAAVEGPIGADSQIILSGSKPLAAGNRVRVVR